MASTQNIERALRERFGSEETIITLADVLSFLKSHPNSYCAAGNQNKQQQEHGAQQNAPSTTITRDQTRQNAPQGLHKSIAAKTQGPRSCQGSAKPFEKASQDIQATQSPTKPSGTATPPPQGTQGPTNPTEIRTQLPQSTQS